MADLAYTYRCWVNMSCSTHSSVAVVQANDKLLEDPASLLLCQAPMRPVS